MVAIRDAVAVLVPTAIYRDYDVIADENGERIIRWSHVAQQPTQAQLDAVTQSQVDAALLAKVRDEAKAIHTALSSENRALRAVVKLTVDELNLVRQAIATLKTVTAASTNYATLKSGIATLPATPDRTYVQARNAINALIDSE